MLVPTRDLGVQVYQITRQLPQFTSVEVALSVVGLDPGATATTTVEAAIGPDIDDEVEFIICRTISTR